MKQIKIAKDETILPLLNIKGLDISPYPNSSFQLIKFIEEKDFVELDDNIKSLFIKNRIFDETLESSYLTVYLIFVDSLQLSYHNFENIISLDVCFQKYDLKFNICDKIKSSQNYDIFTFDFNKKRKGDNKFKWPDYIMYEDKIIYRYNNTTNHAPYVTDDEYMNKKIVVSKKQLHPQKFKTPVSHKKSHNTGI